jgi:anhydro-N-acetylmuramic acid kinase
MRIDGPIRALGAMSGTSLDGVDAAVVITDGDRITGFGESEYRPYTPAERATLREALGRMPGEPGVAEAAGVVEAAHAEILARFDDIDLVGVHGQTLAHRPDDRLTHQAGDGALLAEALELPVVWDFRTADVTLGGQGAPLAPFFHFACARWAGATEPLAFLNIGGVANLTWIDPTRPAPEAEGALLAFDTGPGNAPLDDFILARTGQARDEDGRLSAEGRVDRAAIDWLMARPYFLKVPPKSLDRDDFRGLAQAVAHLSDADGAATLAFAVAASVAQGLAHCPTVPTRLLVTGGGRHNPTIMAMLARATEIDVAPVEEIGLNGDMLEAQAFAYLAVRVARGWPTSAPGTTGVAAPVGGGRLSRPGTEPLDFPLPWPPTGSAG